MNRNMILRAIMLVLASHLLAQHLNAALPTSGEWPATTITADETVNLTGDVSVSGTITINNGIKLTINNNTGSTIRITPTATMDNLFSVNVGGELVINGNASGSSTINYNGIIIDGGASLTWNNYQLNGTTSFIRHAIYSLGNFDIKNVTIQNIYRDSPNDAIACNGILSDNGDRASISHCEFKYIRGFEGSAVLCRNANSGGSTLDISDSHFVYCCTYDRLGSTIRSVGISSTTLSMKNCCVEYCNSNGGHGGAVYWNAHGRTDTCCKFDGCRFLNNRATRFGGGLFIETSVFFINNKTTIQGNIAYDSGGGICINGYIMAGGKPFTEIIATINDKLEIIGNSAPNGRGGGFYCCYANTALAADNATITYNIDGAVIKDNKAGYGGGIYFLDEIPAEKNVVFTVNLNYGDITGNTATNDGGGIYLSDINIGNNSSGGKTCNVSGNTAKNGGGIFIENGNLKLDKVDISKNTATESGGGVCIDGGTFAINSGTISENSCTNYGGGVYSSYTGSDYIDSSLSGGSVRSNTAFAGGGICVDGNINFTTTSTNIEGNNATNGGGICVINGANMTYKSGLVRSNTAKTATTITGSTAYLKDETQVEGFGGGVFVADNGSSLTLDISDGKLGLYGNLATNGADDIFVNGNGTSVTVPNVTSMTLTDFSVPVPANSLFWAEDYSTDDTGYGNGTKINTAWSGTNLRYRNAWKNMQEPFHVPAQTLTKYTSLALGYGIIYVTVKKTGLKKGQSAIFQLTKQGDSKPYITVILTGKDDSGTAVQRSVALFAGTWTVKETNWSWAYSSDVTEITHSFTKQSDAGTLYEFVNTPRSDTPQHNESIKVNRFRN